MMLGPGTNHQSVMASPISISAYPSFCSRLEVKEPWVFTSHWLPEEEPVRMPIQIWGPIPGGHNRSLSSLLDAVGHACDVSMWEGVEVGRAEVQGHPQRHGEFRITLAI